MEGDVVVKGAVVLAVLLLLWVLADWGRQRERARRLGRVVGLLAPEPPEPPGPPIERLLRDARRIRASIRDAPAGTPVARMNGWLEAYDEVLVLACRALDLDHRLETLTREPERSLERERVERMLARTGLFGGGPS